MRRAPLDIDEPLTWTCAQSLHQGHESYLRCIAYVMEHRFTSEQSADFNAIQTAHEFRSTPHLDRVGEAELMEAHIRVDELLCDPPLGTRRIGARTHHTFEAFIEGDGEAST